MKPLKDKISITVDGPVIERIRELAEAQDRSVSQYINLLLKAHISKIDKLEEAEPKNTTVF